MPRGHANDPPQYTPTYLEAPEDVQEAVEMLRQQARAGLKPAGRAAPAAPAAPAPAADDARIFRPFRRPPLTLLCIIDDGKKEDGEWLRLRSHQIIFGRVKGDVCIPFDDQMSGRHAELVRLAEDDWRWTLQDLGSTNGTFVRIAKTGLADQSEFLIGSGHYRFEKGARAAAAPEAATRQRTVAMPDAFSQPALVEVLPRSRESKRHPLTAGEYWIGRDPRACAIHRADDDFTSPRHARLYHDPKHAGHWILENNKSTNGLWLRVNKIQLGRTCQFQLGEQRFLLQVLE
jgi:pSer/pThr/pTyr-binding forkhead associated (FHA) protein